MHNQKIAYTNSICGTKPKKHLFAAKSQIRSIPGASLSSDEAIAAAKGGAK
jgi:hypothetical protein